MLKAELRKIYLAKQKSLSRSERAEKSRQIANLFFQHFDLSQINFLHCFLPLERTNEIDTRLIFQRIWQNFAHIKTLVPRVDFQTNEIESVKFTPATKLKKNQWQIDEPDKEETVETKEIDAVLVPLLCFDRKGFRIGYGKGFYDRFLINCRPDCLKIGLSYFATLAEITDVQVFDVQLGFCLTPEKIVNCE